MDKGWNDLDPFQKAKKCYHVFINAFMSGSWTLVESDPVWCVFFWGGEVFFFGLMMMNLFRWRNAVGIGIFIVVCFFFFKKSTVNPFFKTLSSLGERLYSAITPMAC